MGRSFTPVLLFILCSALYIPQCVCALINKGTRGVVRSNIYMVMHCIYCMYIHRHVHSFLVYVSWNNAEIIHFQHRKEIKTWCFELVNSFLIRCSKKTMSDEESFTSWKRLFLSYYIVAMFHLLLYKLLYLCLFIIE